MASKIKKKIKHIFSHRGLVLLFVFAALSCVLVVRIFQLQIIHGQEYADNFTITTTKTRTLKSTRGNIYDCNGNLIAYNQVSNSVTLEDDGTYSTTREKNLSLNGEIYRLIKLIEGNGDTMSDDFHIDLDENDNYIFDVDSENSRNRFRADIYGYSSINSLSEEEAKSTPEDIINLLAGSERFAIYNEENPYTQEELSSHGLPSELTKDEVLKIVRIRYRLSLSSFQKYVQVTIATNVSDATVAAIKENSSTLQGVSIEEDSIRVYNYAEAMSSIIGYTGSASSEELDELLLERDDYTSNSIIGKTGIEQYMETTLQGHDGSEEVAVDNLGTVLSVYEDSRVEPQQGNDVYLTIDAELQEACYNILEQRIAGILVSNIRDVKYADEVEDDPTTTDDDDIIYIPIYDVYHALFNNSVIDIGHFTSDDATLLERDVYQRFLSRRDEIISEISQEISGQTQKAYNDLDDEMKAYMDYVVNDLLKDDLKIIAPQGDYTEDETYKSWKDGSISTYEFLYYCASNNWIDMSQLFDSSQYADPSQIIEVLCNYVTDYLTTDDTYAKLQYKYMLLSDLITPREVCQLLYDQDILSKDDELYLEFSAGEYSPYDLIVNKISNLEITPAQLALDPCSGSIVVTDPDTGDVKAMVTYPGYDNNRLANTMDTDYYWKLYNDKSTPFYNKATQQLTAPGSTFKPVMVAAGITEDVVDNSTVLNCNGLFGEGLVDSSSQLHCWYLLGHGDENIVDAIRNSCNVYFCTIGYRLGLNESGSFSESQALSKIQEYASMFDLDQKTNIQLTESSPQVTDQMAIPSSIGQGTHLYTTTQLARYASTIYNNGDSYNLNLLQKVTDSSGNTIQEYHSDLSKTAEFSDVVWSDIHQGMREVVTSMGTFQDFPVELYGKTGTAEEDKSRPNHALFIGHANYDTNDDIAFAVRIAYGYSSTNAAVVAKDMLSYYYGLQDEESVITGEIATDGLSNTVTD